MYLLPSFGSRIVLILGIYVNIIFLMVNDTCSERHSVKHYFEFCEFFWYKMIYLKWLVTLLETFLFRLELGNTCILLLSGITCLFFSHWLQKPLHYKKCMSINNFLLQKYIVMTTLRNDKLTLDFSCYVQKITNCVVDKRFD